MNTKQLIPTLAGVLAIQLGAFAYFATREEPTANFKPTEDLVQLDASKVDKILVEEKDKSTTLVKKDNQWLVPDSFDFPASETKVTDLLKALTQFKKSWPVGKTSIAAKQFSVVDDKFERRISFYAADKKLKTVYLGTSPGFKKVHIRVDEEADTFSVAYNSYEAPTNSKDWLDKKALHIAREKVKSLNLGAVSMENKGGDFVLADLPEGKVTNVIKTSSLAAKATALDFEEVLGRSADVAHGPKALAYEITKENGDKVNVELFKLAASEPVKEAKDSKKAKAETKAKEADKDSKKAEDEFFVLNSSQLPYAFRVRKAKFDELAEVKRDELIKDKDAAGSADSAKSDAPAGDEGVKTGHENGQNTQSQDDELDEDIEDALADASLDD